MLLEGPRGLAVPQLDEDLLHLRPSFPPIFRAPQTKLVQYVDNVLCIVVVQRDAGIHQLPYAHPLRLNEIQEIWFALTGSVVWGSTCDRSVCISSVYDFKTFGPFGKMKIKSEEKCEKERKIRKRRELEAKKKLFCRKYFAVQIGHGKAFKLTLYSPDL